MPQPYILSFAEGLAIETPSADRTVIRVPITCKAIVLDGLSPGIREVIAILASTGATEETLAGVVLEKDGSDVLPKLYYLLKIFTEHRILCYGIACYGQRLATLFLLLPLSLFPLPLSILTRNVFFPALPTFTATGTRWSWNLPWPTA
jgi:hypothetical protein